MMLILRDDRVIETFDSPDAPPDWIEWIDVQNGEYLFCDERGQLYRGVLVRRGAFFTRDGIALVPEGTPDPANAIALVEEAVAIEPGSCAFGDLSSLRRYIYSLALPRPASGAPTPSLEERIIAVGREAGLIRRRLDQLSYRFTERGSVLPGPEAGTEAAIERIEREAGELPLAIKLFWRHVGSINFIGDPPGWHGCEYPDPLVVYPPSAAIFALDEFLSDREERLRSDFPYLVPIAPDEYHKQNVSGGMWYNLSVPAAADDPPLNDERHQTTFVSYLELAMRWGGFPGLDRCPGHDWPLERLVGR